MSDITEFIEPIKSIEHVEDCSPDYELAEEIHADTPERMKALGNRLRLTICDLVLEHAMSVTELAERVARPKGSVAHHVDVLVSAGILRVVRTRKVRAIKERLYGRVARTIVLPDTPGELPFIHDVVADADYAAMSTREHPSGFTFRHARIPAARASDYVDRLQALALEFVTEPRGGEVEYGLYVGFFPTIRTIAPASATGKHAT